MLGVFSQWNETGKSKSEIALGNFSGVQCKTLASPNARGRVPSLVREPTPHATVKMEDLTCCN